MFCSLTLTPSQAPNNHKTCDLSGPNGCQCCAPKAVDCCCELCHPEFFVKYKMNPEPQFCSASKSHQKSFIIYDHNHCFKDELFKWWKEKALAKFGTCYFNTIGTNVLISDNIIDQIVACTHWQKIKTINNVKREMGWCNQSSWVLELGDSLMEIIMKHLPPAPLTPARGPPQKRHADPTCTTCKQPGHMSKLSFFQFILLLIQTLPETWSGCSKKAKKMYPDQCALSVAVTDENVLPPQTTLMMQP